MIDEGNRQENLDAAGGRDGESGFQNRGLGRPQKRFPERKSHKRLCVHEDTNGAAGKGGLGGPEEDGVAIEHDPKKRRKRQTGGGLPSKKHVKKRAARWG